jgi:hypothetical protein
VQAALWVVAMVLLFAYGRVGDALVDPERSSPCVFRTRV